MQGTSDESRIVRNSVDGSSVMRSSRIWFHLKPILYLSTYLFSSTTSLLSNL